MPELSEVVDAVDGIGEEVARAVMGRFASVDDLAAARKADLQEVPGVTGVLATRLLEAARASADPAPRRADDELPPRLRDAIEDAAVLARPLLRVVDGDRRDDEVPDDRTEPRPPTPQDAEAAHVAEVRRNHPAGGHGRLVPAQGLPAPIDLAVRAIVNGVETSAVVYRTVARGVTRLRRRR